MISALLIGAGLGLGLWALVVWALPPYPRLGAVLQRLDSTPSPPPITAQDQVGWTSRLGTPFVAPLGALGLPSTSLRKDLSVTGGAPETHLSDKAALGIVGLVLPSVVTLALTAVGMPLPWTVSVLICLVLGVLGFLFPDLGVRRDAAARRRSFRLGLSAFLNLVRVALAGGAGVEAALNDAASVGRGWAFSQIRRALTIAHLTRTTPWSTLRTLGDELDVRELTELAASVSLAETEGAKVRSSLRAKAAALRGRELTDAEGEAQAATERMSLPVIVLFLGFLLFIGYPAVAQVLGGI